jgi:hypothetical protein
MAFNKFVGITMLLYGLINPIGVIPIYMHLIRRSGGLFFKRWKWKSRRP